LAVFYNEEQPGFGFTVAISVFLHIVFIAFMLLLANDSSSRKITAPIYTVDLFAPEKPAASQRLEVGVSRPAAKEKAIVLKKEKEPSLDEAIKKIRQHVKKREAEETIGKAIQGLENRQVDKRIGEIKEKVAHRQVIRPIKKDTGLIQNRGNIKKIEEIEEKYGLLLWEAISPKWNYTGNLREGEFVVIAVRIDKTGHLIESHIEQPSANPILLQSAVRAIEKAAPLFPPFPKELEKNFVEIGVCFPECGK